MEYFFLRFNQEFGNWALDDYRFVKECVEQY